MKKLGKEKLVEVLWNDAYHLTDPWLSNDQIADTYKKKKFQVTNVGWIIYEDDTYIILAGKRSQEYGDWGFVMMIPKGMIVKMKNKK